MGNIFPSIMSYLIIVKYVGIVWHFLGRSEENSGMGISGRREPSAASVAARFPTRRGQHSSSSTVRHVWQQWVLNTYESFCSILTDDAVSEADVVVTIVALTGGVVVNVAVARCWCCSFATLSRHCACYLLLPRQLPSIGCLFYAWTYVHTFVLYICGLSKYLYLCNCSSNWRSCCSCCYCCICISACIRIYGCAGAGLCVHIVFCVWQIFVGNHLLCSVKRWLLCPTAPCDAQFIETTALGFSYPPSLPIPAGPRPQINQFGKNKTKGGEQ